MMRVPGRIVMAVRAPDGRIALRQEPHVPLSRRVRLLGIPVVRGAVSFIEMLAVGLKALNYSPLPSGVAKSALAELSKITVNGQAVTPSASVTG